jgi:hypothetical protein
VHCDIRPSNIIFFYKNWFLIDSAEAVHLADNEKLKLRSENTKNDKSVFNRNIVWSPRFDYYQLGKFIEESAMMIVEVSMNGINDLKNILLDKNLAVIDPKIRII